MVPVFIEEEKVRSLLDWEKTFSAVEVAMKNVSSARAFQNPRSITSANGNNVLLTMPGYLEDEKYGALACKLVTATNGNAERNPPLPNIQANIAYFDEVTGQLKAIIAGTEITTWRTAAASAVATKQLHIGKQGKSEILAIMGAGVQGRIHALCFQHFFNFKEVRIWNHKFQKCVNLANELNSTSSRKEFEAFENAEDCVNGADVIVTATNSKDPIVKKIWVKEGVHINAVGAVPGSPFAELDMDIYKTSDVFIDYWAGAKTELAGLEKFGVQFKGEVGSLLSGTLPKPEPARTTVFQSLGMAAEDCAMARLIYDLYVIEKQYTYTY